MDQKASLLESLKILDMGPYQFGFGLSDAIS
jgi:hypothetical protein